MSIYFCIDIDRNRYVLLQKWRNNTEICIVGRNVMGERYRGKSELGGECFTYVLWVEGLEYGALSTNCLVWMEEFLLNKSHESREKTSILYTYNVIFGWGGQTFLISIFLCNSY